MLPHLCFDGEILPIWKSLVDVYWNAWHHCSISRAENWPSARFAVLKGLKLIVWKFLCSSSIYATGFRAPYFIIFVSSNTMQCIIPLLYKTIAILEISAYFAHFHTMLLFSPNWSYYMFYCKKTTHIYNQICIPVCTHIDTIEINDNCSITSM